MGRGVMVDDEVYVLLMSRAESMGQSPSEVLRGLLVGQSLPSPAAVGSIRPTGMGALKPLLTGGLVAAGDELVFEQRRKRLVHRATVTADGCVLAGGEVSGRCPRL